MKKLSKGVKKAAKATYNFAIGDDIKTIKSKKTKWYQKAGAAISIDSNFIPGGGLASKAVKAAIKGTSKAYKAAKATKKATTKIKRSPSKKASSKVNKKPKTVSAKPIRTAPKVQSKAKVKVAATVKTKPKIKTYVVPKQNRGATVNRVAKNAAKTEKKVVSPDVKVAPKEAPIGGYIQSTEEAESQILMKLDLQLFAENKGNGTLKGTNQKGEITNLGSFRKRTVQVAWDNAEPGPNGGKLCPTCKKEVKVKPYSGDKRDWDIDHNPSWTNREFPANVTRKRVLDNYQEGIRLECSSCNIRGGNRRN